MAVAKLREPVPGRNVPDGRFGFRCHRCPMSVRAETRLFDRVFYSEELANWFLGADAQEQPLKRTGYKKTLAVGTECCVDDAVVELDRLAQWSAGCATPESDGPLSRGGSQHKAVGTELHEVNKRVDTLAAIGWVVFGGYSRSMKHWNADWLSRLRVPQSHAV